MSLTRAECEKRLSNHVACSFHFQQQLDSFQNLDDTDEMLKMTETAEDGGGDESTKLQTVSQSNERLSKLTNLEYRRHNSRHPSQLKGHHREFCDPIMFSPGDAKFSHVVARNLCAYLSLNVLKESTLQAHPEGHSNADIIDMVNANTVDAQLVMGQLLKTDEDFYDYLKTTYRVHNESNKMNVLDLIRSYVLPSLPHGQPFPYSGSSDTPNAFSSSSLPDVGFLIVDSQEKVHTMMPTRSKEPANRYLYKMHQYYTNAICLCFALLLMVLCRRRINT